MNWKAANQRRYDATLSAFYVLIARVLLIVRSRLEFRGSFAGLPSEVAPVVDHPSCPTPPGHHYSEALGLLRAAEAAVVALDSMMRAGYEFLKPAGARSASPRSWGIARRCGWPSQRLDSS